MADWNKDGTHRIPLLGEVISIVDKEVTPVHMNEGAHAEVLRPVALLPSQLLALTCHMEVLQNPTPFAAVLVYAVMKCVSSAASVPHIL